MNIDKIVCVGKNYLEHAKELGDAVPEKPVLFLKPPSVLRAAPAIGSHLSLFLPTDRGSVHHECEAILKLRKGGSSLTPQQAREAIGWVSVGLDMTLRDRQALLKKNGHPWEVSKVFVDSAVAGPWVDYESARQFLDEEFSLEVNGVVRQRGMIKQMMMKLEDCVAYASEFFPLSEGDLFYTGTPAGVAAVSPGDRATLSWGPIRYTVDWRPL